MSERMNMDKQTEVASSETENTEFASLEATGITTDPQPENIKRSGSSDIRKRRYQASKYNDGSIPGENGGNVSSKCGVSQSTYRKTETDESIVKTLLEEVVEAAERRKRRSIQETEQDCKAEVSAGIGETETPTVNTVTERNASLHDNDKDNMIPEDMRQTARQSCKDMDYTDEDIEKAVKEFREMHDGNDGYCATDLAKLIEKRQDEVTDASNVNSPPRNAQTPEVCNPNLVTNDGKGPPNVKNAVSQYTTCASVTDYGHPVDQSTPHMLQINVPLKKCKCGCEHEISFNFDYM